VTVAERIDRRINHRLRHQRQLRGWTLEDVAEELHLLAGDGPELGVVAHMVGRWERGVRRPSPPYVRLLSLLFELPPDALGLVDEAVEGYLAVGIGAASVTWSLAPSVTMTVAGGSDRCGVEGEPA
jgi:transcriptional regulator with XRE-family HTH domain